MDFKNLLVTGGCGFIGANFIRFLLKRDDFKGRIINVDKLTYAGNKDNLIDIEKDFFERYVFIRADINDKVTISYIFKVFNIDAICHFAAESHVDNSINSPNEFIHTNIVGTFTLLEISRISNIKLFYAVSTDEVFGSIKEGSFTETSRYNPSNPYSASKASSDHLVYSYYKTFDLPIITSNCTNNYGPYQFEEKLIPLVIYNAINNKKLPVYGDGKNIRDWLYVEDHCNAIWTIMTKGKIGEYYNIGGGCEINNIDMVKKICNIIDSFKIFKESRLDLISFVEDRPGHDFRYSLDYTKLSNELGWYPLENIDTGLYKTVEWYLNKWM